MLVQAGDPVQASQMLARLDDRDLQLQAADAQASGASAQAKLAQAKQGNATPQDLAAAQASVANAEANLQKARTGNVTKTDIASAQAELRAAQAKLDDVQKRQYYETFVQAEAAMHSAEKDLAVAQVTYAKARQDEITQIQDAEAKLADAQQQLDTLHHPTANDLAQAQASVDQARANLQKLQQGGTPHVILSSCQRNEENYQSTMISVTDLHKTYKMGDVTVPALQGVSFTTRRT